jgi:predicted metal-dependent enzyme (double-stranded beta helix superfamily)
MHEIERRTVLFKLPMAAAAFVATIPEMLSAGTTWEEFTSRTAALARELQGVDEETYVYRLAAETVNAPDVPPGSKTGRFGKLDPPVEFGPVFRGAPIMIIQWKLAPNAWLPPHNHPHYDVVTIGLEGEALLTHYDVDGDAPAFDAASPFAVRRTRETLIAPRRVSPLTSSRDNIHTFKAGPKGARGIDINTRVGDDIGFSFLKIEPKPLDAARGTFSARWIGQTP